MINEEFTGFPKASYYFTSEGQPKKNVCVCTHSQIICTNIYTKSFTYIKYMCS